MNQLKIWTNSPDNIEIKMVHTISICMGIAGHLKSKILLIPLANIYFDGNFDKFLHFCTDRSIYFEGKFVRILHFCMESRDTQQQYFQGYVRGRSVYIGGNFVKILYLFTETSKQFWGNFVKNLQFCKETSKNLGEILS